MDREYRVTLTTGDTVTVTAGGPEEAVGFALMDADGMYPECRNVDVLAVEEA